jgi:hypothetical protein
MLGAGRPVAELRDRWRAFVRDGDVVCSWGRYATALFVAAGGVLPEKRVDLRQAARVFARGKVGTLEDFVARTGAVVPSAVGAGRAGVRLGQLATIVRHLQSQP